MKEARILGSRFPHVRVFRMYTLFKMYLRLKLDVKYQDISFITGPLGTSFQIIYIKVSIIIICLVWMYTLGSLFFSFWFSLNFYSTHSRFISNLFFSSFCFSLFSEIMKQAIRIRKRSGFLLILIFLRFFSLGCHPKK